MSLFTKIAKIVGDIMFGIILIVGLTFLVSLLPLKNNYKVFSVMSGSMEPAIPVGSLIFVQPSAIYAMGDIVTYAPSDLNNKKDTTTHRISGKELINGVVFYSTKGDANNTNDSVKIKQDQLVGKYIFKIPYLGYLLSFIKTLTGLVLIVIIPATIIIYEEFRKIANEAKNISKIRQEKKRSRNEISS
ncbi:MAG: Signal peptidase I W [bacterium ADurb.Bin212]|jgi:signal peptidase|nr:MAG: Signal peptidase I W [bacterium ADurb.Bin212]